MNENDEKAKLGKNFFIISIITLIVVIMWVGLEVYWAWQKNTISTPTQIQMKTLTPNLNKNTFDKLEQRIDPSDDQVIEAIKSNKPIVTITPSNEATKNGTLKKAQSQTVNNETNSLNQ